MPHRKDMTGMVFGKLTVTSFHHSNKHVYWNCKCSCGKETVVEAYRLKHGLTRSCGCLIKDTATKHGISKTSLYNVWIHMIDRCENPHSKDYSLYGMRGIKVCEEWHDIKNFYNWAINSGYQKCLKLERVDNDKGYSPNNCKWATNSEQANNRRSNIFFVVKGVKDTLANMARKYGVNYQTLNTRLKRGWSIEQALLLRERRVMD